MNIHYRARRGVSIAAFAAFAVVLIAGVTMAGESEDFRFAKRLQRDKMFVAAAEEFLRFSEKYPASTLRASALFSAGECWMQAGRANDALSAFERHLAGYPGEENSCKARFYRGTILKALKQFREAADELMTILEDPGSCPLEGRALLEAGECLIAAGDSREAVTVLRRVSDPARYPDQASRAAYSLAIALEKTGRDLEAEKILKETIDKYPRSPVAALAMMKLGDRAFTRGEYDDAAIYFRKAADDYKEDSLREKAISKLIEAARGAGDNRTVLKTSEEYLKLFPEGAGRSRAYALGIFAARDTGDRDRAISMIDSWRSGGTYSDSEGEFSLVRASLLDEKGRTGDALVELSYFRRSYPASGLLVDALLLEGRLLEKSERYDEAVLRYDIALAEGASGESRMETLDRLAEISAVQTADTLAALRYWSMIASADRGGEKGEEALWRSAEVREATGDIRGAATDLYRIEKEFQGGEYAAEAAKRAGRLSLLAGPGGDAEGALARLAVDGSVTGGMRYLETGRILLEEAGRHLEAGRYLERALQSELPDAEKARARYFLGNARALGYEISAVTGSADEGLKKSAIDEWWKVAREAPGTEWGGKSHRAWLGYRLDEWDINGKLKRLNEFLGYYGGSGGHYWWAQEKKLESLYSAAPGRDDWAADSALTIAGLFLNNTSPADGKREALLKSGYLYRMKGETEKAESALAMFARTYPGDHRTVSVLYDLGETRLSRRDYAKALEAYQACLAGDPPRRLEGRCILRSGDCLYYAHEYTKAAEKYSALAKHDPPTGLEDEAAYRQALALRQAGRGDEADKLLSSLYDRTDLPAGLRARVLELTGRRMLDTGDHAAARGVFEELCSVRKTSGSLTLLGETLLELGESKDAVKRFDEALKLKGADTCRVLSGRSRSHFTAGDTKKGSRDLDEMIQKCPGHAGTAQALLARGEAAVEKRDCEGATATLEYLREHYAGSEAAAGALYQLALCDIRRGGYAEAIERLGLFLRESPESPMTGQVYFKLATSHYASGSRNLAAANYALAAEPTTDRDTRYTAMANQARVFQELEEWEKAGDIWKDVTGQFPEREDIVEIFFNLGFCYSQAGDFELAWEVYRRIPAVALTEEQQGRAHYWAGISLKYLNRCDEAIREFLRVPYLRTGGMWGVTAKLEAAVCYEKLGRLDEAKSIYSQVVSSHGENSDWGSMAKKSLERLEAGEQQPENNEE
ncbi:MAG: tetratricopeptide repeat protein [Candidatus Krumholzibacteria bacterium]|nr:tetratricopeptide repeat protein [Candidatus Krumholzibacteria bacterium]